MVVVNTFNNWCGVLLLFGFCGGLLLLVDWCVGLFVVCAGVDFRWLLLLLLIGAFSCCWWWMLLLFGCYRKMKFQSVKETKKGKE